MLIGVISDTHGLLREEVVKILRPCDVILHAGDIGNSEVLGAMVDLFMQRGLIYFDTAYTKRLKSTKAASLSV